MLARTIITAMLSIILMLGAVGSSAAQEKSDPRAKTGGAQTLEDILARQQGQNIDDEFRRNAIGTQTDNSGLPTQLGTLGGASDAELWRSLRFGTADLTSAINSPEGNVVIQDGGMRWLQWRAGPVRTYGGYLLLGMLGVLLLFYLIRGRILIEGEKTGETVLRFKVIERIAHWTMAIPFVLLAITGLILLFGRVALIPLFGHDVFTPIAIVGKFVHNYLAWPFMLGVIMSFVLWAWKNLPEKTDIAWVLKAGGLFTRGVHPSAGKFNAGEKLIFWSVMLFGVMVSATGLSLLFPFQIPMFTPVFELLNFTGIPQILGFGELNTALAPQEEMQFAQLWHMIIAFVYMAIVMAHIYLGSVGMEGALSSMTKGTVEVQWAKEHHDLWYKDVVKESAEKTQVE